ncbi:MAG: tetratricopeptide repeat protein [Chthoniobacterales bacterium]
MVALIAAETLAAQDNPAPQAGTARDLILKADGDYNAKRYPEAVAGYKKLLDDFGASTEMASDMPHVLYNLAAALMQAQKFDDAVEAIVKAQGEKGIGAEKQEDLAFWRGFALLQTGNHEEATAALGEFLAKYPKSVRRPDAALLSANALLSSGKTAEAAQAFEAIRKSPNHPHRGRAAVREFYCLVETDKDQEALQLLAEEGPGQAENINQLVTLQVLALGLGEKLLEAGQPRPAIRALQNIWPRERLVTHQKRKLEEIKADLAKIESALRPDVVRRGQQKQLQLEVEKELANLEKIPSFDASVRFRMATAFHQQERYRESALLLDDVLREMKPDAVVETASLSALQSWMSIERYDKAVEVSQVFEERFPGSKSLPLVFYLRGTAQQKANQYEEALATFSALTEKFPKTEQAPRAFFMKGFTQLLAEQNEEAAVTFADFLKAYPDHELAEAADYWQGSALTFGKKYPEAREILAAHASKFPKGNLLAAAAFRHAYCAQAMKDYPQAEIELKAYLEKFPGGEEVNEARILLGDTLLTQAKSEEGKEIYATIPATAGRWHEDAQFKRAKVLKLEEDHEGLRTLMQKYLALYPKSPRAAEALFLIGQSWRQQEQPEKASEEYWRAIKAFGNDPEATSVEELFLALAKNQKDEAQKLDYLASLRELRASATAEKQDVLAVRTIWALAQAVRKSDPVLSGSLLREAAAMAKPETTNPRILADCAEEQLKAVETETSTEAKNDRKAKAARIYRDLLKWHPRAMQKDKALAALAQMAAEQGDQKGATDFYARLERDTPWSPLVGEALANRARMETDSGHPDRAVESYNRLLAAKSVPGKLKAQALLAMGELEMARNRPEVAVPYYQRIYILYGKWRETVAKAYLRSGEAFEKLNDQPAARKTYEELSNSTELASFPEAATARERLQKLGGASS